MRRLKYIVALLLLLVAVSCSTSQKIMVSGDPGTEILSPQMDYLGTIGMGGQLQLTIPSDSGYEFLLSKSGGDGKCIPFALDYEHHKYAAGFCMASGITMTVLGTSSFVPGIVFTACGLPEVGLPFLGAAAILTGIGMGIGIPGDYRMHQKAYRWEYMYLNDHSTNQDIVVTDVVNTGFTRRIEEGNQKPKVEVKDTPTVKSTISARSFKDNSKAVVGVYLGSGKLKQRGVVIERFIAMSVDIQQIDKKTVAVDVKESGESFFYSKMIYTVEKDSQGGYLLKSEDIPEATIKIDSQHNLVYSHSSIEIDGELYSLEVNGCKK